MTQEKKGLPIVVIALILITVISVSLTIFCFLRCNNLKDTSSNIESHVDTDSENSEELPQRVDLSIFVSASLVWWDQDNGFESIKTNGKYMYSISPFWYELGTDASIRKFSGAEDQEILGHLKKNNILVIPIISNEFQREPVASIISNPEKREVHINDIVSLTTINNYDGISLNYENLNPEDKDDYTEFVTLLSEELHNIDKLLTIHLHAKTSEPGTWNGPQAQDWEALGKVCDKVKIMAYDYHWSTSEAGAIAPPFWVEEVVTHAINLIPEEKIYLGIPLYGYDWIEKQGTSLTHKDAIALIDYYDIVVKTEDEKASGFFTYSDTEGNNHEVWYENADSVRDKLKIAKEYELGGIDFWRLGGEDEDIWESVEGTFAL
jgi:spore germination protein YaaH